MLNHIGFFASMFVMRNQFVNSVFNRLKMCVPVLIAC